MKLNILTSKTILRTPLRAPQQKYDSVSILKYNSKNDMKKYESGLFSKK